MREENIPSHHQWSCGTSYAKLHHVEHPARTHPGITDVERSFGSYLNSFLFCTNVNLVITNTFHGL